MVSRGCIYITDEENEVWKDKIVEIYIFKYIELELEF